MEIFLTLAEHASSFFPIRRVLKAGWQIARVLIFYIQRQLMLLLCFLNDGS